MATYKRFEDLPVWQTAADLYDRCDVLIERTKGVISRSFADQLERAALSVSNNIAEGFERGTTNELLMFVYIARASAGEVRSMLRLLQRRKKMVGFAGELEVLVKTALSCSRQLRAWAESLQESEIRGQRHLTAQSKEDWQKKRNHEEERRREAETNRHIVAKLPPNHILRIEWEKKYGKL